MFVKSCLLVSVYYSLLWFQLLLFAFYILPFSSFPDLVVGVWLPARFLLVAFCIAIFALCFLLLVCCFLFLAAYGLLPAFSILHFASPLLLLASSFLLTTLCFLLAAFSLLAVCLFLFTSCVLECLFWPLGGSTVHAYLNFSYSEYHLRCHQPTHTQQSKSCH